MGNICRSPSGEAVMNSVIEKAGLENKIKCDSAGTIGFHAGESADPRMIEYGSKRNYVLSSIARKFHVSDFEKFDYIIAMDNKNLSDLLALDLAGKFTSKITKMTDHCTIIKVDEVPDPYYGGSQGFEHVLDIIEDGCNGLLKRIITVHPEMK